jgi:hypothetical protein
MQEYDTSSKWLIQHHGDSIRPPDEHENHLAVRQILAGLRYNDSRLFQLLGGRVAMIESPVPEESVTE